MVLLLQIAITLPRTAFPETVFLDAEHYFFDRLI